VFHCGKCHNETFYSGRHYAECHYAECPYAECHFDECLYAECVSLPINHEFNAECHYKCQVYVPDAEICGTSHMCFNVFSLHNSKTSNL